MDPVHCKKDFLDSLGDDEDESMNQKPPARPKGGTDNPQEQNGVIDLCNDDDDDNDNDNNGNDSKPSAASVQIVGTLKPRKRPRMDATTKQQRQKDQRDAIDVDSIMMTSSSSKHNSTTETSNDHGAGTYRQAVGPLRFDFCSILGHHTYARAKTQKLKMNTLFQELVEYKLNLPVDLSSAIFVRVLESRLDLIRAVITGPSGTPYGYGCFFFDIHLADYPNRAPSVKFLTTGKGSVRFNPNLYHDGKVCLSLLGTWRGPGWISNKSTLLQVLVSIQGLILGVAEPYYNEPGFERYQNNPRYQKASKDYNTKLRRSTIQWAMKDMLEQLLGKKQLLYPEFEEVMEEHFCHRSTSIQEQLDEWMTLDHTLVNPVQEVKALLDQLLERNKESKKAKAMTVNNVISIDDDVEVGAAPVAEPTSASSPVILLD